MTQATRRRICLIGIVMGLWLAAAAWKSLGRPFLGSEIPSWLRILSNSLPSLIGGLTVPLGFLAAHPDPTASDLPRVVLWSVPLLIVAEIVELAFRTSRFDWYDLGLSLAGVALTSLVVGSAWRPSRQVTPADSNHVV